MRFKKPLVIMLILAFTLVMAVMPALATEPLKAITTNGEGIIKAKPEIASIYLSVENQGKTAKEARNSNANLMNKVIKELKKLGITKDEIQSVSFNIFPIYNYNSGKEQNKITGYQASNQIIIKTGKLDEVGVIIDTAIEAGANNVQNVAYSVKDEEAWSLKALEKATLSAQKKAKTIAQTLGLTIKGVNGVNEQSAYVNPYYTGANFLRNEAKSVQDSTPIQAPQFIEVRASVSISFGI